jgi:outer membrane protein assembly factor BamB
MEKLAALGYVTGVRGTVLKGVTRHDPSRAYPGLNLYSSGHGPEAILMDMTGKELHRWRFDFKAAFPDFPPDEPHVRGMEWWCWLHAFENGDLLAIFSGAGLIKIDVDSKLLWTYSARAHHDVAVAKDGTIYVLTREPHVRTSVHPKKPILEDYVSILRADGTHIKSFSIIDAFEGTPFAKLWRSRKRSGDLLHTNSIELLGGRAARRAKAFAAGDLLVSIHTPGTLAVIDPRTEKVVWATKGIWRYQHDAQITDSGSLLLFDNLGARDHSRVLEYDPRTMKLLWQYEGSQDEPLLSQQMGSAQRLPNGNTLIAESEGGRAIEVTRDGDIVWEFYTPYRSGVDGEFIACMCRIRRVPALAGFVSDGDGRGSLAATH